MEHQVFQLSTWHILDQGLQRQKFAIGVHRRDVKSSLEIILVHLLECLENLRNSPVHEIIDSRETDLSTKCQKNGILFTKKISVVRKTSLWSFNNSIGTFT
jgi:hypothetical protein